LNTTLKLLDKLRSPEVQDFIKEHAFDEPHQLLLKHKSIFNVPTALVVDQIVGRKKAKEKLPSWYRNNYVIYPPSVNLEQTSSERAARFKAELLTTEFGDVSFEKFSGLDLTGGFGVDSFFMAQKIKDLNVVETDEGLLEIAKHNHVHLGNTNIQYNNTTAAEFLKSPPQRFDFVYADPSRRTKENKKVISLNQCEPDLITLQNLIWEITDRVIVKISPLLDIHQGIKEMLHVKKVIVLSIENECKELLFVCEKTFDGEPLIDAVNLDNKTSTISFRMSEERIANAELSDPLKFLYEPNTSLLKAGAFKTVSKIFDAFKIHPNTHLYTSNTLIRDFPGRIFEIENHVSARSSLAKIFPEKKANVITRNYPLTAEELKKKSGLKDGGEKYLIGFSGLKKKFLVSAKRLF
jgi:16S rRNA G966 N2-methylase RsmD